MLYSIDKQQYIGAIPHQHEYDIWKDRLTPEQFQRVWEELNDRIDGDEIHTSSWIPGNNWAGTVYEPLANACEGDLDASGKFFGLILWEVMLRRPEVWSFGRYEKDGIPIQGMTYFRLKRM